MNHVLRTLFFTAIIQPLILLVLGLNLRGRQRLPQHGPAIIVANHNSHLDVFAIMYMLGLSQLKKVRPVAAADYFLTRPLRRWFATRIVGIIPIDRQQVRRERGQHPLEPISKVLEENGIVLLFPEGTRGQPEQLEEFQSGVAHLAKRHPEVPIIPIYLHGLGKALPKGEAILVPFFCDAVVGKPLPSGLPKRELMEQLGATMSKLQSLLPTCSGMSGYERATNQRGAATVHEPTDSLIG